MSKIAARWRQRESEGLSRKENKVIKGLERSKSEAPRYPSTPIMGCEDDGRSDPAREWLVEEKLDGANCAVWIGPDGHVGIRDRTRALRKGVSEGGWAKKQFAPLWERAQRSKGQIQSMEREAGMRLALYGEWLLVVHGREYEAVGDLWRPWGLWSMDEAKFLDPFKARALLLGHGFEAPAQLGVWRVEEGLDAARALALGVSGLGGAREGAVFKLGDGAWQTGLGKVVALGFEQGALWDGTNPIFQKRA